MKAEQRVVVGTQILRKVLMRDGAIEHPADCDAINVGRLDSKTYEPTREEIHDDHYPVALEPNGFTAEQVDAS